MEELEARLRRTNTVLKILGLPLLILFLFFGTPLLGVYFVSLVSEHLDCHLSAAGAQPCFVFGKNIGGALAAYALPVVSSIFTPFVFVGALATILPTFIAVSWLTAVLALIIARRGLIKDIKQRG